MENILVLDFGGQYNQLIARRVRECQVYCEVHSSDMPIDEIKKMAPKGIILTGGPNSVYDPASPHADQELFSIGIPILGICYGAQILAYQLGGKVSTAPVSEYGKTETVVDTNIPLFRGWAERSVAWMSHTDYIEKAPEGFTVTGHTSNCPVAAMQDESKGFYAVQFHPEVVHTDEGMKLFRTFVYDICGCKGDWQMGSFIETTVASLREKIGSGKVLLGLSGGVDSSVAAALLSKAVGRQLTCVFVDHGLLRKNEGDEVEAVFGQGGQFDLNFVRVDAAEYFYEKLAGVTEPEQKRKIIGAEFINVFEKEAEKIGEVDFLAQGTIYPDVIESGLGKSATIKSHHNVGGLPEHVNFKEIVEPLRMLFKDEVRQVGLQLGIPEKLVYRQPFPGPGLGIRIIGDITSEKVRIVQDADAIYREEIDKAAEDWKEGHNMENPSWMPSQYYAALTNLRSVGVMGDGRTYDYAVALRAVITSDFMTATAAPIPWDILTRAADRIVNEVSGVNRVFYDCTSKPPATIELE
jgi:GMP synthase (glutamine-hydrolysing)